MLQLSNSLRSFSGVLLTLIKVVNVMEEVLYNSLSRYFERLGQVGYVPYNNVYKLLILSFIREIVDNDYRGYITKDDYPYIE